MDNFLYVILMPYLTNSQNKLCASLHHAGWVCYAEKTHGSFILPYISSTKSPQQVMGSLVKHHLARSLGKKYVGFLINKTREKEPFLCSFPSPNQVYHVTVMPCFDKKLEASRDDFYSDLYRTRDVDCVITSGVCVLCVCSSLVVPRLLPNFCRILYSMRREDGYSM